MSKVGSKPGESSALRLFRAGKAIAPTLGKLARASIARTPAGDGPGAPQGLAPRVSTAPGTPRPLNRENLSKLGRLRLAVHDIRAEMNAATPVVGPHQRRSRVLIDAISVELKKHPRFDKYGKHVDRFPAQALELWDAAKGLKASLKDIKGPLKEMKAGFMEALREDWTFAQTPATSEAETAVHTPEPETPTSDTFTAGSEDDITPESKLDIHIDIEPDADATSNTGSTIDFADIEKPPLTPVSTEAAPVPSATAQPVRPKPGHTSKMLTAQDPPPELPKEAFRAMAKEDALSDLKENGLLFAFREDRFSSLNNAPRRRDILKKFVRGTEGWDQGLQVAFLKSLVARPIGAHFFDHMVSTMKKNKWDAATCDELMLQCTRQGGGLASADSATAAHVLGGVLEHARKADPATRSALYESAAYHIDRLVPVHPDAFIRKFGHTRDNMAEYKPNPPTYDQLQSFLSTMLGDISSWPPEQQTSTLKALAKGAHSFKHYAPAQGELRDDAERMENQCLASIRRHVEQWDAQAMASGDGKAILGMVHPVPAGPSYAETRM